MKRTLIGLMLATLAIAGGSASAETTVAAGTLSATGAATQVSEEPGAETWSIGINASFAGLVEGVEGTYDYACTLTANGIAATKPIPDDNPSWVVSCANGDASQTLQLEMVGGNRPLQRGPVVTGWNFVEVGGPATINGELHEEIGHVATCRGLLKLPTIELACVIL